MSSSDSTSDRATPNFDAVRALRHDLRNHLATVRNAAFFLERKTRKSSLWEQDERVAQFFELIESELDAAVKCVTERVNVDHLSPKDRDR